MREGQKGGAEGRVMWSSGLHDRQPNQPTVFLSIRGTDRKEGGNLDEMR